MWFTSKQKTMPSRDEALPGRSQRARVPERHAVIGHPLAPPYPEGLQTATFGLGLLLGRRAQVLEFARRLDDGGGLCRRVHARSDLRGGLFRPHRPHRGGAGRLRSAAGELRRVVEGILGEPRSDAGYAPDNDVGTQYRSAVYVHSPEQRRLAEASRDAFQTELARAGYGAITTEIADSGEFYFAEDYHQQYLAKNPGGYCGLGGTGVACPSGLAAASKSRPTAATEIR